MPNSWITFVKKYASENNISYGCAMSMPEVKNEYQKSKQKPKQKELDEKIKEQLKFIEDDYHNKILTNEIIGKSRLPPNTQKTLKKYNEYYKEMTGKYLPSESEIRKQYRKQYKQYEKDEDKRMKKLEEERAKNPVEYEPFIAPTKRKKIGYVL